MTKHDHKGFQMAQRIDLIGIPTDAGAGCRGASMGPAALRVAGLAEHLTDLGFAVEDKGDVLVEGGRLPLGSYRPLQAVRRDEILTLAKETSALAEASLTSGALPVFLGGDHSLSMGSVAGVARHCRTIGKPLFVLWFDAHTDFNTPLISPSGNMHGMSLALLCDEPEFESMADDSWHAPVRYDHVSIFGARSIDAAERALLAERGVEVMDMRLIDEIGAAPLIRALIERVAAVDGHLHLSLDVDALDPSIAPGVGTTVPGGLTYREAHLVMEMLHDSGLVGSLDIVELNPFLDHAGQSARVLVDLAGSLFGRRIVDRPAASLLRVPASAPHSVF